MFVDYGITVAVVAIPVIYSTSTNMSNGTYFYKNEIFRLVTYENVRCKIMHWQTYPREVLKFFSYECFNKLLYYKLSGNRAFVKTNFV